MIALVLPGALLAAASAQSSPWTLAREQTILPGPLGIGVSFGKSVSIDGEFMAVGNPESLPGKVAVYQFIGGSWSPQATLDPVPGPLGETFGASLSLNGDTLAIGASSDSAAGTAAGACYVYVRTSAGWNLQSHLFAPDAAAVDYFGSSVSLDGDSLLIGSPWDDDSGSNSGSAYVFTRVAGVWTPQSKLLANDGQPGDHFGTSVAIKGDFAIIGAPLDADQGLETGSAYAFSRSSQNWTQQSKLLAPSSSPKDHFGQSVSVDVGTVLIGAPAAFHRQAVGYCFVPAGNNWVYQATLRPVGPTITLPGGQAGVSVDLDGDRAIIGVPSADVYASSYFSAADVGGAFLFERHGLAWEQVGTVTREPIISGTLFGWAVGISGDRFVAGIPGEPLYPGGPATGAATTYQIVPAPVRYCTAKLNSLSCAPLNDFRGIPSASNLTGFQLLCTNVINNEPGLLIYSTSGRVSIPFQGGTLCLAAPVLRSPVLNSYGSPAPAQDCSGVYSLDWSGFAAGTLGGSPSLALRVPGTRVQSQWWGRDPGFPSPFNTTLSDAIEFTLCP